MMFLAFARRVLKFNRLRAIWPKDYQRRRLRAIWPKDYQREEPPERRLPKNNQCKKVVFPQESNLLPLDQGFPNWGLQPHKGSRNKL